MQNLDCLQGDEPNAAQAGERGEERLHLILSSTISITSGRLLDRSRAEARCMWPSVPKPTTPLITVAPAIFASRALST